MTSGPLLCAGMCRHMRVSVGVCAYDAFVFVWACVCMVRLCLCAWIGGWMVTYAHVMCAYAFICTYMCVRVCVSVTSVCIFMGVCAHVRVRINTALMSRSVHVCGFWLRERE